MCDINIIKIGGNVIDDPEALKDFLNTFASIEGKKILVHGGGKEASRLSIALGVEPRLINGRRITDKETIGIVTMVYAGLINKRIVAYLQSVNCNAIGLCGADGNVIRADRRSPVPVDFGFVGDIDPKNVSVSFISELWQIKTVPVFSAICHDGKGDLLNCNADSVAAAIAVACSKIGKTCLTYCFEKPGVLADINDDNSVIPNIRVSDFGRLVSEGIIAEGMIPKLQNSLNAIKDGVEEVRICSASSLTDGEGTMIRQ